MSRVVVHVAALVPVAAELRRIGDEYDASAGRLGRIAEDLPPSIEDQRESIRRSASRLRRNAAEFRQEAADLARRCELVQDHVSRATLASVDIPRWEAGTLDDRQFHVDQAYSGLTGETDVRLSPAGGPIAFTADEASGLVAIPPAAWSSIRRDWNVGEALRLTSQSTHSEPGPGSGTWPSGLAWDDAGKGSLEPITDRPDWNAAREAWLGTEPWS